MEGLRLGEGLILPVSFATEGVVAVGMRGSGKSNTLVRWAEVLYTAGVPFVAIDPKGDWGGIRSSADGTKPGLAVPVFGGVEESFPLTETLGAAIADLLVDHNISAVVDVSRLSIAARARFLTDFCKRLMDRHQTEPHVRCVILEEAHRYIPQQVTRDTARVKEAVAAILLEGRAFGLGCWAATQRPARLHKDVLEEAGTAVLHRIGAAATNDLRTISGWVKHEDLGDEIVPSLTRLRSGEAWILAPSTLGIAQRVLIDRRTTYDSAATPVVGASSRPTLTLADVDAAAIKEALAETIERAKADDPRELRRRIAQLERDLATARASVPEPVIETVEVPVLPAATLDQLRQVLAPAAQAIANVERLLVEQQPRPAPRQAPPPAPTPRSHDRSPLPARDDGGMKVLAKAERSILTVLAQHPDGRTRTQLTTLTGYTYSGGFRNALAALRTAGCLLGGNNEIMRATDTGLAVLGDWEPLPTGRALLDYWLNEKSLGKAERSILAALIDRYPEQITGPDLAHICGYEFSGGFRNALSKLRTLELVVGSNTTGVAAHDDLLEAIGG